MARPLLKKTGYYSYGDYMNWPDDERWEIIDGILYNMTPAPNRYHQYISGNIFSEIRQFLKGKKYQVYAAPFDIRLPFRNESDEEILNVVQPDISVICDRAKLDIKGCKGAPDMIIEILSPYTSKKDRITKFNLYERFGVKEYWLVCPEDKSVEVFTLSPEGKYGRPEFYTETDSIPCLTLQGLTLNPTEIFAEKESGSETPAIPL